MRKKSRSTNNWPILAWSFDYLAAVGQLVTVMAAAPVAGVLICLLLLGWSRAPTVKQRLE